MIEAEYHHFSTKKLISNRYNTINETKLYLSYLIINVVSVTILMILARRNPYLTVITQSNFIWYKIQHFSDWGRISLKYWTHERQTDHSSFLTVELWGVFSDNIGENWPHHMCVWRDILYSCGQTDYSMINVWLSLWLRFRVQVLALGSRARNSPEMRR